MSVKRNDVIDAFRGVAILAVIAFHYTVRWAPPQTADFYGYDHVFHPWLEVGAYGVHLFFVISGLVITMTVLRAESAGEFLTRRLARIYPAFWVAMTATFLLMQFGPDDFRVGLSDYLANLVVDAADLGRTPVDGAYWSLVVELKFYAYVALARWLLKDRFHLGLIGLGVAAAVIAPAAPDFARKVLLAPYWTFFLAGMGAWYGLFEKRPRDGALLGAAAAVLYLATYPMNHERNIPAWLVDGFIWGFSGLMFALLWRGRGLNFGPLAAIGRASYSVYLVHEYVGVWLIGNLSEAGVPDAAAMGLVTAGMIGLGFLMYEYVEKPGQRWVMTHWRTFFAPRGTEAPARA